MLGKFLSDETGGTSIEYGLIGALLVVALVTVLASLGTSLGSFFEAATSKINSANTPSRHVPP
jgi:pilus assembly protein Flp/PilA